MKGVERPSVYRCVADIFNKISSGNPKRFLEPWPEEGKPHCLHKTLYYPENKVVANGFRTLATKPF